MRHSIRRLSKNAKICFSELVREGEYAEARACCGAPPSFPSKHLHVVGIDEAGVGAVAGPITAVALYMPPGVCIPGLADSKSLSQAARREVFDRIMADDRIEISVSNATPSLINSVGHLGIVHMNTLATAYLALEKDLIDGVLKGKYPGFDFRGQTLSKMAIKSGAQAAKTPLIAAIVDGKEVPKSFLGRESYVGVVGLPKADLSCASVAAASIVAKTLRDNTMQYWHEKFPKYGFNEHFGYGTAAHQDAIMNYGPCEQHRVVGELASLLGVSAQTGVDASSYFKAKGATKRRGKATKAASSPSMLVESEQPSIARPTPTLSRFERLQASMLAGM